MNLNIVSDSVISYPVIYKNKDISITSVHEEKELGYMPHSCIILIPQNGLNQLKDKLTVVRHMLTCWPLHKSSWTDFL